MKNIFTLFQRTVPKRNSRLQVEKGSPAGERTVLKGIFFGVVASILSLILLSPSLAHATDLIEEAAPGTPQNLLKYSIGETNDPTTGTGEKPGAFDYTVIAPLSLKLTGYVNEDGVPLKQGLLMEQGHYLAMMFEYQPGLNEYFADLLDNIGIPTISHAYAQGTGYSAMSTFLPFWKAFRNLAYSLYIVMFVVVGVMIMLRTKVNAQTIITIQTALPNLLITLLLITFSYAIVGFMIDLMYFLIYFVVYLFSSIDIIRTPTKAIDRLLSYSAWSVIFEGRNTIIKAVSQAITQALSGLGTGALGVVGAISSALSWIGLGYLLVAVWLAVAMLKLMWTLMNCYFMLLVQTITAPIQILMNAMPGSKAFSEWLKKTASYLIPFPVVACMFIFAAVLIGDPSRATIMGGKPLFGKDDGNPFGINPSAELYSNYGGRAFGTKNTGAIWLPPFTLTDYSEEPASLMVLLGFFIITMTPAAAKMAMDWLQVKASPYTSEIGAGMGGAIGLMKYPGSMISSTKQKQQQISLAKSQARWNAEEFKKIQGT